MYRENLVEKDKRTHFLTYNIVKKITQQHNIEYYVSDS